MEPILCWEFVVVDKYDEVSIRVLKCFVPRQRDVLLWLDAIRRGHR
jgi:hypothetical protein